MMTIQHDSTNNTTTSFLSCTTENIHLNQYWYSNNTIKHIINEIESIAHNSSNINNYKICFLSTPSLYFSLNNKQLQHNSVLFDYDEAFGNKVPNKQLNYVQYDFNDITTILSTMYNIFDCIVIDPPFITEIVWQKYADAVKLLLKQRYTDLDDSHNHNDDTTLQPINHSISNSFINIHNQHDNNNTQQYTTQWYTDNKVPIGKIILTTIPENANLLYNLLHVQLTPFRPSIPNLIYQYSLYTNYKPIVLNRLNNEIDYDISDLPEQHRKLRRNSRITGLGSNDNIVTTDQLQHGNNISNNDINNIVHSSRKQAIATT